MQEKKAAPVKMSQDDMDAPNPHPNPKPNPNPNPNPHPNPDPKQDGRDAPLTLSPTPNPNRQPSALVVMLPSLTSQLKRAYGWR